MASQLSLFVMSANDQAQEPTVTLTKPVRPPTIAAATTSSRGRKPKNKCQPSKKQPQRGLGVAQLERLRLQDEKWKTNNTQLNSLNLIQPTPITTRLHVFDPPVINNSHMINCSGTTVTNDTMQYGSVNYGVPTMINGANGLLGVWDQLAAGMAVKRVDGNFGFNNGTVHGSTSPQVLVNQYNMARAPVHQQVGTLPDGAVSYETSKELSSMPKQTQPQQYESFRCDVCLKKKRFSTGENIIVHNNGKIDNFGERSSPINGSCFLGLNQGNNIDFYGQMGGFGARAAKSAFYANHNHSHDKGVQVMAIHRKGNYSLGENNIFMEYEFFPGKHGKNTFSNEVEFGAQDGSVAMGTAGTEAASCVTSTSDYSGHSAYNASNSIDLSLKLSY